MTQTTKVCQYIIYNFSSEKSYNMIWYLLEDINRTELFQTLEF